MAPLAAAAAAAASARGKWDALSSPLSFAAGATREVMYR